MSLVYKKNKAIKLREKGHSLREISEKLLISKSTASVWLRDVKISKKGKKRLIEISNLGREKALKTWKIKREIYFRKIDTNCAIFNQCRELSTEESKIYLSLLFWGEGSKNERRLTFTNSDPNIIQVYLSLLRSAFDINEEKFSAVLHLHSYHDKDKMLSYWSKKTKIKKDKIILYNKSNSGKIKREGYKGCISIRYGNVKILDEIFVIIERIIKNFAGLV